MPITFSNISIIGMGLMGGSIAKALKKRAPKVQIASMHAPHADLKAAIAAGAVDVLFDNWQEIAVWSDLVILATPLSAVCALAQTLSDSCPQNKRLLVVDIGSVKQQVASAFEALSGRAVEFLSSHPMAGKEMWGFEHSEAGLFEQRPWAICPHANNTASAIAEMKALIRLLGGKPLVLSPEEHDKQAALISHLPALLSKCLLEFVSSKNPEALQLAGPGFQSMTRLAKDNPALSAEWLTANRAHIQHALDDFLTYIYPNNFKIWEFDKEAPQNYCSERVTIAERQGTSENKNFEVRPTPSKTKC